MITTQKIVKLFSNTLASLVCLMSTYVFALELPYSARLVLSDETDVKNISVEISAWDREKGISRRDVRGRTTTKVFQIDGTSLTLDQMLQPIITHLNDKQLALSFIVILTCVVVSIFVKILLFLTRPLCLLTLLIIQ